jgi:hypothetical protein
MSNNPDNNKLGLQGKCLKCFYLGWNTDKTEFECMKYRIVIDGIVESCPSFMPIGEGLEPLIADMNFIL